MDKNNYGSWKRPLKIKRIVEYVTSLEIFDVWNAPPTKAYVKYYDTDNGFEMSNPIKIRKRKDNTYYVLFEGCRYDIDISLGNKEQYVELLK